MIKAGDQGHVCQSFASRHHLDSSLTKLLEMPSMVGLASCAAGQLPCSAGEHLAHVIEQGLERMSKGQSGACCTQAAA